MKITKQDAKNGIISVIAENLDDIWHLHNIISEGDLVTGLTYRTAEKKTEEDSRSKKSDKKPMVLGIRVEKVAFHEFSDRLRIQGTIEEGPQDLGSHHTLNITADDHNYITIKKDCWKHHHLQRLKEAVEQSSKAHVVFVSLDEDTATIAVLHQSGLQKIADVESHRSGKMYDSDDVSSTYYGEIISVLKPLINSEEPCPLVILGPGFTREHLGAYGKDKQPELFSKQHLIATGNAGLNGIHEALKMGLADQIVKDNRVALETQHINSLMEEIKKDGLATYGYSQVEAALNTGAVQRLLISDQHAKTPQGEHLLDLAQKTHSDWTIINTQHDTGKTFQGMGGIAALLRFKIAN